MKEKEENKVSMMRVRFDTKLLIDQINVTKRTRMSFDSIVNELAKEEIERMKEEQNER